MIGKGFCAAALLAGTVLARPALAAPPLTYEKDILPLFQKRCVSCHGGGKPRAGLDLRTLGSLRQGAASGKAVAPGFPEKSPLFAAIRSRQMPPTPQKFSPAETERVLRWIKEGARGEAGRGGHWAFQPLRPRLAPPVDGAVTAIDAFVLADRARRGKAFAPEADRRSLLRRVTFDLTGLPPTPEDMAAFQSDRRPDAYERVVDRLLASPAYGERMARFWLDLAGYADSEGVLQEDRIRPNAWRYRDYVIRSFNADKPYDRFLLEQIAGDEISGYRTATRWTPQIEEMVTATGFLRTAVDATRDDFNEHQFTEYQWRMLHDTQTILVSTTLGLTLQCARCHDHKYEPLSQKDYYRIQAAFAGAIRPTGKLLPTYRRQVVAATAEEQKRAAAVNAAVDAALQALTQREQDLLATFRGKDGVAQDATADVVRKAFPDAGARLDALTAERTAQERKRVILPEIRALYDQDADPPPTRLLHRGEYQKPGEVVAPGIPAVLDSPSHPFVLPAPTTATTGRRTALARWIASAKNPLTARALVNRIWAQHFGVGLVSTTENLGRSGQPPTNQPLLDWLAHDFVAGERPWSIKSLHKRLVLARAYRQATIGPARRLDAEALRDAILSVTGTLDPTRFGEPVGLEARGTGEIAASGEAGGGRRSIYLQVRRTQPVSFLNAFDAPVMETNCTRRAASATPTQALAQLNSAFLSSQSVHFAHRLEQECSRAPTPYAALQARIGRAFSLALSRAPGDDERRQSVGFVQAQTGRYGREGKNPQDASRQALADFCLALLSANEFLYID